MTGIVTNVRDDRGFGFIKSFETGKSYFFHVSELDNSLVFGTHLLNEEFDFDVGDDRIGRPSALNVRPVGT